MKTLIDRYELMNRQTGEFESAELFDGIDEKNLLDFDQEWRPAFVIQPPDNTSAVERVALVNHGC